MVVHMALIGKTGPDIISARLDYQEVHALTGNDWLGSDGYVYTVLYGDAGNDQLNTTYSNAALTGGVTLSWSQLGGEGADTLYSNLSGSSDANANVYADGQAHNDHIIAVAGLWHNYSANLIGGLYDDWIEFRAKSNGDDYGNSLDVVIDCGDSANTVTAISGSTDIPDAYRNASFTITSGINNDVISAIAHGHYGYGINTINSGDGNDTIYADAFGRIGTGASGTNVINTAAGGDVITAVTAGTNTIDSGDNNDVVKASAVAFGVAQTLSNDIAAGSGNDRVLAEITVPKALDADWGDADLTNDVRGGEGNDILHAVISGLPDVYTGEGTALNKLYGGDDNDTITAELVGTYRGHSSVNGGLGRDLLTVIGGEDNSLNGGGSNDTLIGSAGSDVLTGGPGEDFLTGNGSSDTFAFDLNVTGTDVINDFRSNDRLYFAGLEDHGAPGLLDDLAAVTRVKDDGQDVRVLLDNGAPIIFHGLGDGTIHSLSDFISSSQIVSDPWDA
jgi:hypothetical protein